MNGVGDAQGDRVTALREDFGYCMRRSCKWLSIDGNLSRLVDKILSTSCLCERLYLGCGMIIMSIKLGFTVWHKWYRFPSKTMDAQHPVISQEIGGSLIAPWLLLSVTASRISFLRRFLRQNHQLDIPCWETPFDRYGMLLISFLRRKHLLEVVSQKHISCDLCTSFALCKAEKTFGRFQLEASRAYKCKQILGLCQVLLFETNDIDFLAKPWMCNTLWSLRRLVVVCEQFHDCYFC